MSLLHWNRYIKRHIKHENTLFRNFRELFREQEQIVLRNLEAQLPSEESANVLHIKQNIDIETILFNEVEEQERFREIIRPIIISILDDAGALAIANLGLDIDFNLLDPNVVDYINQETFATIRGITRTTADKLRTALLEAVTQGETPYQMTERIRDIFKGTVRGTAPRSRLISRTETTKIFNNGTVAGWQQSGIVTTKIWYTAQDERVRRDHIEVNGIEVLTSAKFMVGGMEMEHPGDSAGGAKNVCNCLVHWNTNILTSKGFKAASTIEEGDLVLTHKLRFRRVLRLLRESLPQSEWRNWNGTAIKLIISWGKRRTQLTVTNKHKIWNGKQFMEADKLQAGDIVVLLGEKCKECGNPHFDKWGKYSFCSLSCAHRYNANRLWENDNHRTLMSTKTTEQLKREYANGTRDRNEVTKKANERTRELVSKGKWILQNRPSDIGWCSPEGAKRMKEARRKNVRKAYQAVIQKNYQSPGVMTTIETLMAEELDTRDITYRHNHRIGNYWVDFLLSDNIVVETDGEYWHKNKQGKLKDKDKIRQKNIEQEGYTVLRFWGKQITTDVKSCVDEVERVLMNHNKEYVTVEGTIASVEIKEGYHAQNLYDFAIDGDESYIASGILCHNCRCTMLAGEMKE